MDEKGGVIINLSAFASFDGWAGEAAFAAGCAATQKMTLEYSRILEKRQIRVNSIAYNNIRNKDHCFRESHKFMHKEQERLEKYDFLNLNYNFLEQRDGNSYGNHGWNSVLKNPPGILYNRNSEKIAHIGGNNKIFYNSYKILSPAKGS